MTTSLLNCFLLFSFLMSLISYVPGEVEAIKLDNVLKPNTVSVVKQSPGNNSYTLSASPYPEIEEVISNLVHPGYIESWRPLKHFNGDLAASVILYNIEGNKYCRNVQRQHSHNRIYYLFNLLNLTLVQACNSCIGYRSPPIQVPEKAVKWIENIWNQEMYDED